MKIALPDEWYGDFGNNVLYRMCKEKSLHVDHDIVHGKLWLIGRSYAAAIERGAKKNAMERAIDMLLESDIDKGIASARKIKRVESENISEMLELHGYMTSLLGKATGMQKRSLASKYLHFHAPNAVFIYDSIVVGKLHELFRKSKIPRVSGLPDGVDSAYAKYVIRALKYRDEILEPRLSRRVSPREVDKSLYR